MQDARISVHVDVSECQTGNRRQKIHLTEVHQHGCGVSETGLTVSPSFDPFFVPLIVCLPVCLTALTSGCTDLFVGLVVILIG